MSHRNIDEHARTDDARYRERDRRNDTGRDVDHRPVPGAFSKDEGHLVMESTAVEVERGSQDATQTRGTIHHPEALEDGLRAKGAPAVSGEPPPAQAERRPAVRELPDDEGEPRTRGAGASPQASLRKDESDPVLRERVFADPASREAEGAPAARAEGGRGDPLADAAPTSPGGLAGLVRAIPVALLDRLRRRPLTRRALHTLTETSRRVTRTLERIERAD